MPQATEDDVFDMPVLWRDQAITALGLDGEAVIAALSPGAAFPAALRSIAAAITAPVGTLVDVGAGAGGASEWLRRELNTTVIAIEPAAAAREVAARRFPALDVRDGDAGRTGLDAASVDVVLLSGVASLIDDLDPGLDEAMRVLRAPGWLAIADLVSADDQTVRSDPNTFRSVETLERLLVRRGFTIVTVGCGPAEPDAAWSDAATKVDEWIFANCAHLRGFREWRDDREHLRHHIEAGDVLGACLVARRN